MSMKPMTSIALKAWTTVSTTRRMATIVIKPDGSRTATMNL